MAAALLMWPMKCVSLHCVLKMLSMHEIVDIFHGNPESSVETAKQGKLGADQRGEANV